jgi:hypothetical protein
MDAPNACMHCSLQLAGWYLHCAWCGLPVVKRIEDEFVFSFYGS